MVQRLLSNAREERLQAVDGTLEGVAANLGAPPRRHGFFTGCRDRTPRPRWAYFGGSTLEIDEMLREQRLALKFGRVFWGAIVKANAMLYQPGRETNPAVAVFAAPSNRQRLSVYEAAELSEQVEMLRRVRPPPELATFARVVADDWNCELMYRIPAGVAPAKPAYLTSILVNRKHLPTNYLAERVFPILAAPEKTSVAVIVPHWYWPPELIQWWMTADAELNANGPPDATPKR